MFTPFRQYWATWIGFKVNLLIYYLLILVIEMVKQFLHGLSAHINQPTGSAKSSQMY